VKYIYIICSGHSGSTLLDLMLSNAADIFSMGEILRLEQVLARGTFCSCKSQVSDCTVWKRILEPFSSYDNNVFSYGADANFTKDKSFQKKFLESYPAFVRQVQKITGADALCDSSKQLDRLKLLSQMQDIELYVFYLQRHPGGVVSSQMRKGRPFVQQSLVWMKRNFEIWHYLKKATVPFKQIQYEALVACPDDILKDIFRFLQVRSEPGFTTNFGKLRHLVEGNRIRMNHQQLRIQQPSLWQKRMTRFQQIFANSIDIIARSRIREHSLRTLL
jgi:hypothetical protein